MNSKLTRWCDGFLEAGWLFSLIATPLFFNIHSDRVFEPDKITLLRSIALMMILIWIVKFVDQQGWRDRSWLKWQSENSIWRMPLVIPMLLIIVSYLVSTLFSVAPRTSLFGSYQRLQGTYTTVSYIAIFAVVLGNLRTQKQVQRIITTIIVVSIPVSIYGMLQRYKLDPLPWGGNTSTRIAGHMGNAIFVAAYLIMATPLTVARIIDSFKNILTDEQLSYADVIRSSIYILTAVVQLIAIYWTQSRGPLLGIGIGMFAFILILLVTLRNVDRRSNPSLGMSFLWPALFVGLGVVALFAADMMSPYSGAGSLLLWLGATGFLLLIIFILAAIRRGWAWLWLSWIGIVGLTGSVLLIYNISTALGDKANTTPVIATLNNTFDEWRQLPTIGRLGTMLDTEEGTSTVRLLIWEGVVDLVSLHEPIESPVSGSDKWNVLRPLIGYGPEAMYVAYNSFYPPELAIVEARNASPDRSHNETFDAIVITGIFGYLSWQILYIATFYYGLKQLGVVNGKRDRALLIALWFGGAVVGSLIAFLIGGAIYLGVAAPFGSIIGLVVYLIYYALFGRMDAYTQPYNINTLVMVSLIAAMIGYYVEIHFGIAIVSTRTYAFVYTALIVVLARMMNTSAESDKLSHIVKASAPTSTRRSRKSTASRPITSGSWLGPTLVASGLMTVIMITFGFGFTNYTIQPGQQITSLATIPSSADIFHRAFFINPRQGFIESPYLFSVVILSWFLGTMLFTCELVKDGTLRIRDSGAINLPRIRLAAATLIVLCLASLAMFFGDATVEKQHVIRLARLSGTFFGLLCLASAVFLFLSPHLSAARAFAGVMGSIATLFAIPLLIAGATIHGILFGIGGIALLVLLWNDGWKGFTVPLLVIGITSLLSGLTYMLTHAGMMRKVLFLAPTQAQINTVSDTIREGIKNNELFILEGQIPIIARRLIEASRIDQYLTTFYIVGFILMLLTGAAIALQTMSATKKTASKSGSIALLVALIAGFLLTDITNLNIIQADMIYKRGKPFDQQASRLLNEGIRSQEPEAQQQAFQGAVQNWQIASVIYEDVVDLTPNEDFYFLWLGRSYLEQSRLNSGQQATLLDQANIRLQTAQKINPLNTDHTANLARLNTRWADIRRDDPEQRAKNTDISKGYYEDALALSPQNSLIRNEYANLFFQLATDCENALRIYQESVEIDPLYDRTYISMADTYIRCATGDEDAPKSDYLQGALDTVDAAIAIGGVPARLQGDSFNNSMATIYLRVAREFANEDNVDQATLIAQKAMDAEWATGETLVSLTTFIDGLDTTISDTE